MLKEFVEVSGKMSKADRERDHCFGLNGESFCNFESCIGRYVVYYSAHFGE